MEDIHFHAIAHSTSRLYGRLEFPEGDVPGPLEETYGFVPFTYIIFEPNLHPLSDTRPVLRFPFLSNISYALAKPRATPTTTAAEAEAGVGAAAPRAEVKGLP